MTKKFIILLELIIIFSLFSQVSLAVTYLAACKDLKTPNEVYYLQNDIVNSSSDFCIRILANNVTLDCQANRINGKDKERSIGIIISNVKSVTLKK